MQMTVRVYDALGMMVVNVTHRVEAEDGAGWVGFHFGGALHVPMTPEVYAGSPSDQLAFLAEALLDMAYSRRM